jgi:hypothetical protein
MIHSVGRQLHCLIESAAAIQNQVAGSLGANLASPTPGPWTQTRGMSRCIHAAFVPWVLNGDLYRAILLSLGMPEMPRSAGGGSIVDADCSSWPLLARASGSQTCVKTMFVGTLISDMVLEH